MLLIRIATKDQFLKRGIELGIHERSCVFYFHKDENILHIYILVHCPVIKQIWRSINIWLGLDLDARNYAEVLNSSNNLLYRTLRMKINVADGVEVVFQLAAVWTKWLTRNNILFQNNFCNVDEMLVSINMLSWFCLSREC